MFTEYLKKKTQDPDAVAAPDKAEPPRAGFVDYLRRAVAGRSQEPSTLGAVVGAFRKPEADPDAIATPDFGGYLKKKRGV